MYVTCITSKCNKMETISLCGLIIDQVVQPQNGVVLFLIIIALYLYDVVGLPGELCHLVVLVQHTVFLVSYSVAHLKQITNTEWATN